MDYRIISTGSKGNAVVLNGEILIDCGVSFRKLSDVANGVSLVLLTHSHKDHFSETTIRVLSQRRPLLRFACGEWLYSKLIACGVPRRNIDVLKMNKAYDYGVFQIKPFPLSHDVPNCGYKIFTATEKAVYATDTGTLDGLQAPGYDLYLLEANYGEQEIHDRIRSKQKAGMYSYETGVVTRHLSKEQCDSFLMDNMGDNSKYVYLHGHKEKGDAHAD